MTTIKDCDREAAATILGIIEKPISIAALGVVNDVLANHRELGAREAIAEVVAWLREMTKGNPYEGIFNAVCAAIERGEHRKP